MLQKRGELTWDTLIPWIIAIIVLAITLTMYMLFNDRGEGAISFLKDMLRFGT